MYCCGLVSSSTPPIVRKELESKTPRTSINYEKPLIAVHENGNVLLYITRISIPCVEIRFNNIVFEMSAVNPADVTKFVMRYFDLILETYDKITITNNFGLRRLTLTLGPPSSSDQSNAINMAGVLGTMSATGVMNGTDPIRKLPTTTPSRSVLVPLPSGAQERGGSEPRGSNEPLREFSFAVKDKQQAAKAELSMLLENMFLIKTMRRSTS